MSTTNRLLNDEQSITLDPPLDKLVPLIEQPEHQGIPLLPRDYVGLVAATYVVPALLTAWWVISQ